MPRTRTRSLFLAQGNLDACRQPTGPAAADPGQPAEPGCAQPNTGARFRAFCSGSGKTDSATGILRCQWTSLPLCPFSCPPPTSCWNGWGATVPRRPARSRAKRSNWPTHSGLGRRHRRRLTIGPRQCGGCSISSAGPWTTCLPRRRPPSRPWRASRASASGQARRGAGGCWPCVGPSPQQIEQL
jgi:hypothetical protein